jgi:hypothetical protein
MSRQITISIPHKHSTEEVKSRLANAIADARGKHPTIFAGARETWTGNRMDFTFSAMGQTATGDIVIEPNVVHLHLNLPWVLAMLAERIKPQLEAEGRKLLDAPPKKN